MLRRPLIQQRSSIAMNASAGCVFCQRSDIADNIIKETAEFRIIADHAPLTEGHLLIVPKHHYTCYGIVPPELDAKLSALKHEVQAFFAQFYAPSVFWEHGIFRQSVFHAHLHCFPVGPLSETQHRLCNELQDTIAHSADDIRTWHAKWGHYFYLEDDCKGYVFPPKMGNYLHIVQEVLRVGVAARSGHISKLSSQQRYEAGPPLIESTKAKWHLFQQKR